MAHINIFQEFDEPRRRLNIFPEFNPAGVSEAPGLERAAPQAATPLQDVPRLPGDVRNPVPLDVAEESFQPSDIFDMLQEEFRPSPDPRQPLKFEPPGGGFELSPEEEAEFQIQETRQKQTGVEEIATGLGQPPGIVPDAFSAIGLPVDLVGKLIGVEDPAGGSESIRKAVKGVEDFGNLWLQAVTGRITPEEFKGAQDKIGATDVLENAQTIASVVAAGIAVGQVAQAGKAFIDIARSDFAELSPTLNFAKTVAGKAKQLFRLGKSSESLINDAVNGKITGAEFAELARRKPDLLKARATLGADFPPESRPIAGLLPAPGEETFIPPRSVGEALKRFITEERGAVDVFGTLKALEKILPGSRKLVRGLSDLDKQLLLINLQTGRSGIGLPENLIPIADRLTRLAVDTIGAEEKAAAVFAPKSPTDLQAKTRIRQLTGQSKVKDAFVDDRTALRRSMQRQSAAARKGFSEGLEEARSDAKVSKAIDQMTENIRKDTKSRISKSIKAIKRAGTAKIPPSFKKEITSKLRNVDLNFRTAKTMDTRLNMLDTINLLKKKGLNTAISDEAIEKLERKTLNDMTVQEIEDLASTVQQIAHLGRIEGKFIKARQFVKIEEFAEASVAAGISLPDVKARAVKEPIPLASTRQKAKNMSLKLRSVLREFNLKDSRMVNRLEELDGYEENGPNKQIFMGGLNDARNQEVQGVFEKTEVVKQDLAASGLEEADLKSRQEFINKNVGYLTSSEKLGVAHSIDDEAKINRIMGNRGWTEKDIEAIVSKITPEETTFLEAQKQNLWDPSYAETNQVVEEVSGVSLPRIPGYSHMSVDPKTVKGRIAVADDKSFIDQLFDKSGPARLSSKPGAIRLRQPGAKAVVNLDYFDTIASYIDDTERVKAFAGIGMDLRQVLRNDAFRENVTKKLGLEELPILEKWVEEVVAGKTRPGNNPGDFLLKNLRLNATSFILGFRVTSMMKAAGSLQTAAALSRNSGVILKGMQTYIRSPKEVEAFVLEQSPQLRVRAGGERDIRELFERQKVIGGGRRNLLSKTAMGGYIVVDKMAVYSTWIGNFNDFLAQNPNAGAKEAVDYALEITLKSNPAPDLKDLPDLFRGSESEKVVTMLKNQVNLNKEVYRHDIFGKAKAGKISLGEAFRRVLWMSAQGLVIGTITRGRLKRTPGELAIDLVTPATGYFLFGNALMSYLNGWRSGTLDTIGFVRLARALNSKDTAGVTLNAVKAIGAFTGMPIGAPIEMIEGGLDIAAGETADPRRLIYNERKLRMPEEKTPVRRQRRGTQRRRRSR